ncbi:hypothetical protein HPB48_002848 [Haemaphysalis longicornis]|uniref:Uncharacterized protein n=1 Tax=Haemaphysalis longicornis TaxID=44386 RepID=A0A9J6F6Q5_HAELO|nr:hypothetical protein HPB48_002848 [Haemaphysalis longicornis]
MAASCHADVDLFEARHQHSDFRYFVPHHPHPEQLEVFSYGVPLSDGCPTPVSSPATLPPGSPVNEPASSLTELRATRRSETTNHLHSMLPFRSPTRDDGGSDEFDSDAENGSEFYSESSKSSLFSKGASTKRKTSDKAPPTPVVLKKRRLAANAP